MTTETSFFLITTLAPVHLGCDQVYEPTSFALDEKRSELIHFDPFRFVESLSKQDREKFSQICLKGTVPSLLEIYKFMRGQAGELEDGGRVPVCPGFVEHYNKTLNLPENKVHQNLNNFSISRTANAPLTGLPYLPGTAVKGALRTAVLNQRNNGRSVPKYNSRDAKKMEKDLLAYTQFESDPFRLVKVSDFMPIGEVKRKIIYGVDCRKWPSQKVEEKERVYQILEVIESGSFFLGTISVEQPHAKATIRQPLTMTAITKAMTAFFSKEKEREAGILKGLISSMPAHSAIPCRIGRHSGAECCTVEGQRQIRIMQGKGKPAKVQDHANTIWLAANSSKPKATTNLRPFGWVELKAVSHQEAAVMQEQQRTFFAGLQAEGRRAGEEKRQRDEESRRQRAAAEEQARQAELQKEAEKKVKVAQQENWQKMSQLDKDLSCLRREDVAQTFAANDASDPMPNIWPRIKTHAGGEQKTLAAAFKERWQADKKWSKGDCSKKQWEKVQSIKIILGEA